MIRTKRFYRSLLILSLLLLLFICSRVNVRAASLIDSKTEGSISWRLYDDGFLDVTGTGKLGNLSYNNYSSKVKRVSIGYGITELDSSFYDFKSLTNVTIPNSVVSIYNAFEGCIKLKEIVIPDSVTDIGWYAFSGTGLEEIVIPDSVSKIDYFAFGSCKSLKKVSIPDSITDAGWGIFSYCTNLTDVIVSDTFLSKVDIDSCFRGTPWLLNRKGCVKGAVGDFLYVLEKNGTLTLSGSGKLSRLDIDFKEQIKTIIITKGAKRIKNFKDLNVETVEKVINKSSAKIDLISYGDYCWCNTNKKKYITILRKGTAIKVHTYRLLNDEEAEFIGTPMDKSSSSIYISSSIYRNNHTYTVTSIAKKALKGCNNVNYIEIPDTVTSIGSYAFYGCKNVRSIIVHADPALKIGKNAFGNLPKGTVITIKGVKGKKKKAIINLLKKQTNAKIK